MYTDEKVLHSTFHNSKAINGLPSHTISLMHSSSRESCGRENVKREYKMP